jgi:hypothetical protein
VNKPIKFVGLGRRWKLDVFYPIHGRTYSWNGRCCVFSRRAQEQFDEEEARRIENHKNEFGFDDFLKFNR